MNLMELEATRGIVRLRCFCMETTKVAGVEVSRVGLGTWAIGGSEWGAVAEDAAIATCLSAVERGINLIDTAPIYGRGRAEEIVGKVMRAHGRRDAFFIATKAGLEWNERGVFANSTAARLRRELEDSLRRLGTDYIDLYQIHWPDTLVPVAEVAGVLAEFQREGKVRALGVSNFSAAQMEEFRSVAPLASDQPPYNIFEREIDSETLPWCAANGVAVLTYSSLCRSLLGGRVHRGMKFEAGDIRAVDPKFQEPRFSQYITAVERLAALARERYGKSRGAAGGALGAGPARHLRGAVGSQAARPTGCGRRRDGLEAGCRDDGGDRSNCGRVCHGSGGA